MTGQVGITAEEKADVSAAPAISSIGEAERVIANLERIMDSLLVTVEEETALVRAGHVSAATGLEPAKAELARHYAAISERIKISHEFLSHSLPDAIEALRARHDSFQALLQINLTVLATAHAVSEGIIRGVSSELARKQVPQTYGASGRPSAGGPKVSQPLAISRTL